MDGHEQSQPAHAAAHPPHSVWLGVSRDQADTHECSPAKRSNDINFGLCEVFGKHPASAHIVRRLGRWHCEPLQPSGHGRALFIFWHVQACFQLNFLGEQAGSALQELSGRFVTVCLCTHAHLLAGIQVLYVPYMVFAPVSCVQSLPTDPIAHSPAAATASVAVGLLVQQQGRLARPALSQHVHCIKSRTWR